MAKQRRTYVRIDGGECGCFLLVAFLFVLVLGGPLLDKVSEELEKQRQHELELKRLETGVAPLSSHSEVSDG